MLPYFYPTTVLVVDDDPIFLQSFEFRFGGAFTCKTAFSAEHALEIMRKNVNARFPQLPRSDECVALAPRQMLLDRARFAQITVAVVDFDMPRMNGLQLCRAMVGMPVKKIMLTGKASVDLAVAAFNEGVIDLFLKKEDPSLDDKIERQVALMQHQNFKDTTALLRHELSNLDMEQLLTPKVDEGWRVLADSLGSVEHYLINSPLGIITIDRSGIATVALACTDTVLREHLEIAQAEHAPPALLDIIRSGRVLPSFPTLGGHYDAGLAREWSRHLYPIQAELGTHMPVAIISGKAAERFLPSRAVTWSDDTAAPRLVN